MLLLLTMAWPACPSSDPDDELETTMDDAQEAFDAIDWDGLLGYTRDATRLVPCADKVLARSTVGSLFRLHGWALFAAGHKDAPLWLGAAYGVAPRHRYRRSLRGPMSAAWTEAREIWKGTRPARDGWVANGGAGRPVSNELPWITQQVDPSGSVVRSYLVGPGERDPLTDQKRSGLAGLPIPGDPPWLIAATAGVVTGAALLTTAAVAKAQYKRNPSQGLYTVNLVTATAGIGLVAGGVSIGVYGVLK